MPPAAAFAALDLIVVCLHSAAPAPRLRLLQDFPLVSVDRLQAFLATKLGKSFLNAKLEKTAKERERLIGKQGIKFVCTGKNRISAPPPAPTFSYYISRGQGRSQAVLTLTLCRARDAVRPVVAAAAHPCATLIGAFGPDIVYIMPGKRLVFLISSLRPTV